MSHEHKQDEFATAPETDPLLLFPEEPGATAVDSPEGFFEIGHRLHPTDRPRPAAAATPAMPHHPPGPEADTKAKLERAAWEGQRQWVESGLVDANGLNELVSLLEVRIAKLTEPHQFADVISGLEKRLAQLTEKGQSIAHAERLVSLLEERAVKATATLERLAKETGHLGGEITRFQTAVRVPRESGQTIEKLAGGNEKSRFTKWLDGLKPRRVGGILVAGLTVLAVAGVIGARAQREPVQISVPPPPPALPPQSNPDPPSSAMTVAPVAETSTTPLASRPKDDIVDAPSSGSGISRPQATIPAAVNVNAGTSKPETSRQQDSRRVPLPKDPVQSPTFTGNLSVQSNPAGAGVYVDREYVGQTPLQLTKLRAGSHVVWIELEGHERWTASVLVTANQQRQVDARLQPAR